MAKYTSCRSSVAIAKLLASEGYSEKLAQLMFRYAKNNVLSLRQVRQYERMKDEISEMTADFSEGERQVLGKFINYHRRIGFETGLRIGLMAFATIQDKYINIEDDL